MAGDKVHTVAHDDKQSAKHGRVISCGILVLIFPFQPQHGRSGCVPHDCALTGGFAEKTEKRNRDRLRNSGRDYRGDR